MPSSASGSSGSWSRTTAPITFQPPWPCTTFAERDGEALQVVHPTATFELPVEVLDSTDSASLMTRIDREVLAPFDLRQGPLLRARLLRLGEERHVLVVTLHHIVCDGWSMPIMVDELVRLYDGFRQG